MLKLLFVTYVGGRQFNGGIYENNRTEWQSDNRWF